MSAKAKLRPGARIHVYWGVSATRPGTILEVWGDPANPTQVLVRLEPFEIDEAPPELLLNPKALVEAA